MKKKPTSSALSCLILLHAVCATAYGNAGVFNGYGQDVQLINSKDIQMVSEDILITPRRDKFMFEGKAYDAEKADYICTFKLKNLSDHSVTVQVGFPLDSQFLRPPYDAQDLAQITNDNHFVVLEGKKSYPLRYSREDKDKEFKSIFLWDMTFAAGERKELRITYTMPFSMALSGTRKDRRNDKLAKPWYRYFESCLSEWFGYVTETGKSWTGGIGHARFRIDLRAMEAFLNQRGLPEYARPSAEMEERLEQDEKRLEAGLDEEARKRGEEFRKAQKEERLASFPIDKPPIFRDITPDGWKETKDGSIVWDIKDYVPGKPIRVTYCFMFCMPQSKNDTKQLIEKTFKNRLTDEDAQDLEDIIRAFYGVKVDNARIAGFLENQKWFPGGAQKKLPSGIIETIEDAKGKK
jgi:hypothetical protein